MNTFIYLIHYLKYVLIYDRENESMCKSLSFSNTVQQGLPDRSLVPVLPTQQVLWKVVTGARQSGTRWRLPLHTGQI